MFSVLGAPALSQFRIEKLLTSLRMREPRVTGVAARLVHFVDVLRPLDESQLEILGKLLTYGPRPLPQAERGRPVLVTPRRGTASPWSSKATDIAHVCGLDAVRRLERGTVFSIESAEELGAAELLPLGPLLHDRMTESLWLDTLEPALFEADQPRPLRTVELGADGHAAIAAANAAWGLALSDEEIEYLLTAFGKLGRDPTDVELMMFAQANSEHCRHKIFNAEFHIDGEPMPATLFGMIRSTHAANSRGVLSAYRDNAAVIEGMRGARFFPDPQTQRYGTSEEPVDILMKVETHNHPTAISPFPGAATGSGGEIRDEGATGIGAKPKVGLIGFAVSNLRIPGMVQPWESDLGKPERIASALEIMLAAPLGAAAFNNEFGRPATCGYFRTFEQAAGPGDASLIRGYHKPIMLAGGLGNVRRADVQKREVEAGAALVVLGGPAMLIGLGGGAASSVGSGQSTSDLDFASVQRGNPEMQRRAQEVIDRCWAQGADNPILLIHDVGAGGLSNALPEAIAHTAGRGGRIDLRKIPSAEPGLSPMEIWCNEAQERYVLALEPHGLERFAAIAGRERCPFAVVGEITGDGRIRVTDPLLSTSPVDMPVEVLLGKAPRMRRDVASVRKAPAALRTDDVTLEESLARLLRLPTVADKSFLITIGDRAVGGLVSRDQMVGPWQVPVADVAVSLSDYQGYAGEAMAIGERAPVALLDAPASGRLAVAEAITNILAADIRTLGDIRLSANWMAACGEPGEDAALYATVKAVSTLCVRLGVTIPVGKDSLSMRAAWSDTDGPHAVIAPVSVVIGAFAPVADARRTLTPQLQISCASRLLLVDLGAGKNRLGGSCWAQVFERRGGETPDLDEPALLQALFAALRELKDRDLVLAYHDRSDGGLLVSLLEMAFAGHCGLDILLDAPDPLAACFAEELGAVLQVPAESAAGAAAILARHGLGACCRDIGAPIPGNEIRVAVAGRPVLAASRTALHRQWSEVSFRMQSLRDNPQCAREEYSRLLEEADPGLHADLRFDPAEDVAAPYIRSGARPAVAVLREQGVNSQTEMAAALTRAGFDAYDVHMTDISSRRVRLGRFHGIVACGGFSYGDVLGAGEGWAKSILFNAHAREEFGTFFERPSSFTLGICNGCQMLAAVREIIPGTEDWPRFVRNRSEQYEARLSLVAIPASASVLFRGMEESVLPVVVAHGEGFAEFASPSAAATLLEQGRVPLRFVDTHDQPTERYPHNPNGSPAGIAGVCSADGRVTAIMPHPERVFRTVQHSWAPPGWGEDGGWTRLFRNARVFVA